MSIQYDLNFIKISNDAHIWTRDMLKNGEETILCFIYLKMKIWQIVHLGGVSARVYCYIILIFNLKSNNICIEGIFKGKHISVNS